MTTKVLVGGLDPSLSNFGMCKGIATRKDSVVTTSLDITHTSLITSKTNKNIKYKNMDDLHRAMELGAAMIKFFSSVDEIYVELPVGSQSARAMASYGVCIGIIAALGDRVFRVAAKDVKIAATGNGNASKQDMIDWATSEYPDLDWLTKTIKKKTTYTKANEHIADSIAALHAGLGIK